MKLIRYKVQILIIIISLVTNTAFYCFVRHSLLKDEEIIRKEFLHIQSKAIQMLVINDIKKVFSGTDIDLGNSIFIDNSFYFKCSKDFVDTKITYHSVQLMLDGNRCIIIDLSKIREILAQLSNKDYLYLIKLNNVLLLSNQIDNTFDSSYIEDVTLSKDYKITIELLTDENSNFSINRRSFVRKKLMLVVLFLTIITTIFLFCIFLYLIEKNLKIKSLLHNKNIRHFIDEQNKFIIQCYKFSKKQHDSFNNENGDYFPLTVLNVKQKHEVNVALDAVYYDIQAYFANYSEYYSKDNIILEFDYDDKSKLRIPFEQIVLNQILISIMYNLLNLSQKSDSLRYIKVSFHNQIFVLSINGIRLNKEIAAIASQRIFYDTINPFVLNFSQIIGLLNQHGVEINIEHNNIGSIIKIDFSCKNISTSSNNEIVDISTYRKKR